MSVDAALIDTLARLRGIGDAYHDYRGELRYFSLDTKAAILRAMGCEVDEPAALAAEIERLGHLRDHTPLPSIVCAHGEPLEVDLNIAAQAERTELEWTLELQDGGRSCGRVAAADCAELWRGAVQGVLMTRRRLRLPLEVPAGYHELEITQGDAPSSRCAVIVSPRECHEPAAIGAGRRLWGVAVQLYTVRSGGNWGIGDFADLGDLVRWLAPQGAGFIGLNPLHALAPADPVRASPYSASNRHFLNVLYIAVPMVPEFRDCHAARARVAEAEFARRLDALRSTPLVDYAGVAAAKFEILELLHREFRERHLEQHTERAAAFLSFVAAGGTALQMHARFDAFDRHLRATLGVASGWLSWPTPLHDPFGRAARELADERARDVDFFLYLQWLADEQLTAAQRVCRELGMPIGLYGDYAVGAHPSGSETWMDQKSFRMGAEIGAPPDPLALKGQGWGIPPPDPVVMQEQRLAGFVRLIRNNMRYYGALRLDHVMSLFRLWWVAAGHSPVDGAYVHYPLQQLLTVLALESARNACLVVGEDLGVVPDEMRRAMPEFGIYHYKVLLFEQQAGRYRRPDEFVRRALATVTTHDMPTVRGFWEGRDIALRRALQLYPSAEVDADVVRERERDRAALLAALDQQGLLPPARPSEAPFAAQLVRALHVYLARSNTALVALQIEDLMGMADPVNVPGTHLEYPNWQRKLTEQIEEFAQRADVHAHLREVAQARD
jgi:4-alpha-glucanotransferase